MTKPARNPFPQDLAVRLNIKTQGDWFTIDCDVCHKFIASGTTTFLLLSLDEIVRRAAVEHLHKTGGL